MKPILFGLCLLLSTSQARAAASPKEVLRQYWEAYQMQDTKAAVQVVPISEKAAWEGASLDNLKERFYWNMMYPMPIEIIKENVVSDAQIDAACRTKIIIPVKKNDPCFDTKSYKAMVGCDFQYSWKGCTASFIKEKRRWKVHEFNFIEHMVTPPEKPSKQDRKEFAKAMKKRDRRHNELMKMDPSKTR